MIRRLVFFIGLSFFFGCNTNNRNVINTDSGVISIADGKINSVVMNFPWTWNAQIYWPNFKSTVGELSNSMNVYIQCYSGTDPRFFRVYELESISGNKIDSLTSNELFHYYYQWLGSLETNYGIDSAEFSGSSVASLPDYHNRFENWEDFEQAYYLGVNDTSNLGGSLIELQHLTEYLEKIQRKMVDKKLQELVNGIESSKYKVRILNSVALNDPMALRIREQLCDNETVFLPRNVNWVQDKIHLTQKAGKVSVHAWCDYNQSLESTLIAESLTKINGIKDAVGDEFCIDGANVMKTHELIMAEDDIEMSNVNFCPRFNVSDSCFKQRVSEAFGEKNIRWLQITDHSFGAQFPNQRTRLPMRHMDMFLNFGVEKLKDTAIWTAFVGKVSVDYYEEDYPEVNDRLSKKDTLLLNSLAARFDEVADTLCSWGYLIKRVPLLLIHQSNGGLSDKHEIYQTVSFNNVLVECFWNAEDVFERNVYMPSYGTIGLNTVEVPKGINHTKVMTEIEQAYADFDSIYFIDGIFDASAQASLHCHFKVIERN